MIRSAALLLVWLAGAHDALGARLVVTVSGIRDGGGTLRVAICPAIDFLKPVCRYSGQAPARAGTTVVTVEGVPPGIYAAQAYQDTNDNGVLDRNWMGMPEEGMGFSNNPPFRFGPPSFADAAFKVTASEVHVSFELRYL